MPQTNRVYKFNLPQYELQESYPSFCKRWKEKFESVEQGVPVIYYQDVKVLKNKNPKLCMIETVCSFHVTLRYKVFTPEGEFRQWVNFSVNYNSLYSKQERVVFFGEE